MLNYNEYFRGGKDAFDETMGAYKQGLALKERGEDRKFLLDNREAAQAKVKAQEVRSGKMQEDMFNLSQNKTASAKDYSDMALKYREMAKPLMEAYESMSEERQGNERKKATVLFAAIDSGQLDIAESIAERSLESAINSGDQEASDVAKMILNTIKQDPDSAKAIAGIILVESMGEGDLATMIDKLRSRVDRKELDALKIEKLIADTGLTNAQAKKVGRETEKLGLDAKKAVFELEAMKSGNKPVDREKTFEQEKKLRDEYQKRTKTFTEMRGTMDGLRASHGMQNGVGDLALVTAFMKMLDPGSVVRESEFANARDTAGLFQKLETMQAKIKKGDLISPSQRDSFLALAKKYFSSYEKHQKGTKKDLEAVVKSYDLEPENVFGVGDEVEAAQEEIAPVTEGAPAASGAPSYMRFGQ